MEVSSPPFFCLFLKFNLFLDIWLQSSNSLLWPTRCSPVEHIPCVGRSLYVLNFRATVPDTFLKVGDPGLSPAFAESHRDSPQMRPGGRGTHHPPIHSWTLPPPPLFLANRAEKRRPGAASCGRREADCQAEYLPRNCRVVQRLLASNPASVSARSLPGAGCHG